MTTINRRILIATVGIAAAANLSRAAAADATVSPYVGFDAGLALQQDVTIRDTGGAKMSFNPGARFDLSAGYQRADVFRLEFQTGFIYNSIDKIAGLSLNSIGLSADLYEIPLMVNALYTVPIHGPVRLFVGGGIGGVVGVFHGQGFGQSSDNTDLTFGYQGILGAKYALNDQMDLGIGYKFLGTTDHDLGSGIKSEGTKTHSVLLVFTFKF